MDGTDFIAPFVPCSHETARAAIEFANVDSNDILVDLGCGDGRILSEALLSQDAQKRPSRVVGVELDPFLAKHLQDTLILKFKDENVTIIEGSMFDVDLEKLNATVLILYLLPMGLDRLKPQLHDWLYKEHVDSNPNSNSNKRRVVTITYSIPDWDCINATLHGKNWLFQYNT